jgi:hypothetical protein
MIVFTVIAMALFGGYYARHPRITSGELVMALSPRTRARFDQTRQEQAAAAFAEEPAMLPATDPGQIDSAASLLEPDAAPPAPRPTGPGPAPNHLPEPSPTIDDASRLQPEAASETPTGNTPEPTPSRAPREEPGPGPAAGPREESKSVPEDGAEPSGPSRR